MDRSIEFERVRPRISKRSFEIGARDWALNLGLNRANHNQKKSSITRVCDAFQRTHDLKLNFTWYKAHDKVYSYD